MDTLPDIRSDFSGWYNEIIYKAGLADHSPVRGSMVILPYGNALWEAMKNRLDYRIKATGHHNVIFPLLIPQSYLTKEAEHVEGFAPEVAVVTYAGGKELDEPYVIRPTSETIIHHMFARWLTSWRDLPLKINQWANIVRWEMRPRPFVRTTEIFWQEGHTAHATSQEALEEVLLMLQEYVSLCQDYLAIPVVAAKKPSHERFPGAEETYTIEGLMQDGKALQMGTSHLLSQSFAHAFDMRFQDAQGELCYPYLTSWGVTTRLVGAVVMTHGDAKGLIIPPRIAPYQVVIIPIPNKSLAADFLELYITSLVQQLEKANVRVHVDATTHKTPGAKFYEWELKGVPLRIEVGARDIEKQHVMVAHRLNGNKIPVSVADLIATIPRMLEELQQELLTRAVQHRIQNWHTVGNIAEYADRLESSGGFYQTGWCGKTSCVEVIKQHKATIRCVLDDHKVPVCTVCSEQSPADVLIAKSY